MGRKDFEKFLKDSVKRKAEAEPFSPARELEEWKQHLDKLYEAVETFLQDYREKNGVQIAYETQEIEEEFSGKYEVRALTLDIAGRKARFRPIGTMLIGTKGLVDLTGPRGRARFILVDKDSQRPSVRVTSKEAPSGEGTEEPRRRIEWTWKIFSTAPDGRYLELNQDSFLDILMGVLGASKGSA